MKAKLVVLSATLAFIASCSNGNDTDHLKDSANILNDTFPSKNPVDTSEIHHPADTTKKDSPNKLTY